MVTTLILFFCKILFIHDTHTHTQRQRYRQRERQAPCRKPDLGLDPGTPGSCPGPRADAPPWSHPGGPSPQQSNEGSAKGTTRVFTRSCVFLNSAKARCFQCNHPRSSLCTLTSPPPCVSWLQSDRHVLAQAKRKLN